MPDQGVRNITPENLGALKSIWEINQTNPSRIINHPMRESLLEKVGLYDTYLGLVAEEEKQVVQETLGGPGQGDELAGIDQADQIEPDILSSVKSRIDTFMDDTFGVAEAQTTGVDLDLPEELRPLEPAQDVKRLSIGREPLDFTQPVDQAHLPQIRVGKELPGLTIEEIAFAQNQRVISELEKELGSRDEAIQLLSPSTRAEKALKTGVAGIVDLAGGALIWAGYEDAGRKIREGAERTVANNFTKGLIKEFEMQDLGDPDFYLTKGVAMLPTLATLIPLALGGGIIGGTVAAAAGIGALGVGIAAAVASALASRPLESAMEAIGTFNSMIDSGQSKEKASEAAAIVFKNNLLLGTMDAAEFALAMGRVPKVIRGPLSKFIRSKSIRIAGKATGFALGSVAEGYEEVIQGYFQELGEASAKGEAEPELLEALRISRPEQKEAFFLGTLAGGLFQAGGLATKGTAQEQFEEAKAKSDFNELLDERIEDAISAVTKRTRDVREAREADKLAKEEKKIVIPGEEIEREGPTPENVLQFNQEELREEIFTLGYSTDAYLALTDEERRFVVTQQVKPTEEQRPELRTPAEIAAGAEFVTPAPSEEVITEEEKLPGLPSEEESKAAADELGLTFKGIMGEDIKGATPLLLFTDPGTKSTIAVKKLDELKERLEASRETFKKAEKPPVRKEEEKPTEEPTEEVETIPEEAEVAETEKRKEREATEKAQLDFINKVETETSSEFDERLGMRHAGAEQVTRELIQAGAGRSIIDAVRNKRNELVEFLRGRGITTSEKEFNLPAEDQNAIQHSRTLMTHLIKLGRDQKNIRRAAKKLGDLEKLTDEQQAKALEELAKWEARKEEDLKLIKALIDVEPGLQAFTEATKEGSPIAERASAKTLQRAIQALKDQGVPVTVNNIKDQLPKARFTDEQIQTAINEEKAQQTEEEDGETRPTQEGEPTEEVTPETAATTEKEGEPAPEEIEPSELLKLSDVPLTQIKTDVDLFQNRDAEFSQPSVDRILRAVEIRDEVAEGDPLPDDAFRIEVFDPILLWRSPDTGELFILQGHSRVEAFKQLAAQGKKEFEKIPAKILENITVEQASRIGKTSNFNQAAEEIIEQAKFFREERERGVTKKDLKKDAKIKTGANSARVLAVSFLNPKGKMLDVLRALTANTDTDATDALNMATWIGKLRDRWPDLTNTHENEIFDELFPNYKTTLAYQNFDNFSERVATYVNRITTLGVMEDEPLNFKNIKLVTIAELALKERLDNKKKELNAAKRKLDSERERLDKLIEAGKATDADRKRILDELEDQVQLITRETNQLIFDFDLGVSDIRKGQTTLLFGDRIYDDSGLVNNADVKKFEMNPEDIQRISGVEIFKMIKELGVNPNINRLLRRNRGRFIPVQDGVDAPLIDLNPKIFVEEEGAVRTLAHEFGHFIDYLPDDVLAGTALGKILVLKQLRKEVIAGEGVSEETFQDYLKERKRLLNNITRLQRRQKDGTEFARKKDGPQVPIQDRIDELTQNLKSIEKNLRLNKDIRAELWKVSQLMRPIPPGISDSQMAYRLSAVELYGDFVSAILLKPDLVYATAQNTWELWFDNLKKKPKFEKKFRELQKILKSGEDTIMERRYKDLYKMMGKDSELAALEYEKIRQSKDFHFWPEVMAAMVNRNWSIIKRDRELIKKGKLTVEESIYEQFERLPIEDAGLSQKLFREFREFREEWISKELDDTDIGVFMFLSRAATQREKVANPLFYTKNESLRTLAGLETYLGKDKFELVKNYADRFNDWWNREVLKPAVDSGWISEEMFVTLRNGFAIKQDLMTAQEAKILDKQLQKLDLGNVIEVQDEEDSDLKRVTFTEKQTYAPFIPQHHFVNSGVGAGIIHQIGTVSDIMNPVYAGIFKAIAMRRAALRNTMKRDFANHAIKNYEDANEWKKGSPKPSPGRATLSYRDNGKQKWVEAPSLFIDAFERSRSKFRKIVTKILGIPNHFFRLLVVVLSPGFQAFNIFFRDVKRTARGINLGRQAWWSRIPFSKTITRAQLTFMYLPTKEGRRRWEAAFSKARMKPNDYMKELLDKNFLQPNLSSYLLQADTIMEQQEGKIKSVESFLDRMGVIEIPREFKNKWIDWFSNNKLSKSVSTVLEAIRIFGDAGETMGKLVPYEFALEKNLVGEHEKAIWKNEQELLDWIRDFAGTPAFTSKGHAAASLNQISVFYNITVQGGSAFARQMITGRVPGKFRRSRAWIQYIENIAVPLFISLLGYYAFKAFSGGDDDEDESFPLDQKSKDWAMWMGKAYNMIGNYDKANFIVYPIGYLGYDGRVNLLGEFDPKELDNIQKVVYVRIPMADEQRWIHGVTWYTVQAALRDDVDISDITEIFDYTTDQTPSIAPILRMFYALGQFAIGQNPLDDFYNQEIIDKEKFRVGHPDIYLEMAEWSLKQLGISEIGKFRRSFLSKTAETEGIFEQFIRVIPIANRFIKVSNRGEYEFFEAATRELENEKILEKINDEGFIDGWTEKYLETFKKNKRTPQLSRALEDFADLFMRSIQNRLAEVSDTSEEIEGLTEADYKRSFNRLIRTFWRQTGKAVYNTHMSSLASRQSNASKEEILQQLLPINAAREMQRQFPEDVSSSMGAMSMPVDDYIELLTIAKISGYINQELTYNYIELADKFGRE